MKKYFVLLFLILELNAQSQITEARVDSLLASSNPAELFSGVILVADKGKIIFNKAYGYRLFQEKVTLQKTDIFELASVSKQFTAAIVLICKEKGLLNLDDLAEKYVHTPYQGITIRHLLTHTSGLPDYQTIMDRYWDKSKVAGNEEIIAYLNQYAPPVLFAPGEKYRYSNTGYVLLASIAEKASGKDFIQLCNEWIFKPLKMKHTAIRTLTEKAAVKTFAIGHVFVKNSNRFVRADSFPSSNYTIWLGNRKGPGRISSTAGDLLKWDRALYTQKIISNATKAEAFAPMLLTNGKKSDYGFGWDILSDTVLGKIVWHNGDNPGYKTQIIRCIDADKTIIVLSNNYAAKMDSTIAALREWIK